MVGTSNLGSWNGHWSDAFRLKRSMEVAHTVGSKMQTTPPIKFTVSSVACVALPPDPYPLKNGIWGGGVVLKFHFKIPFLQSCFLNDQYSSSFHVIGKQVAAKCRSLGLGAWNQTRQSLALPGWVVMHLIAVREHPQWWFVGPLFRRSNHLKGTMQREPWLVNRSTA